MTVHDLMAHAKRMARTADQASAAFATALAEVLLTAERKLRIVVSQEADGPSTAILKGQRAAQAKIAIRAALVDAGYDDLMIAATDIPLDTMANAVLALRAADTELRATAELLLQIEGLKALHLADVIDEGDELARALWQATVRGIFGSQSVDAILADLATVIDRTAPQIRTLYDTAISIFGRQVEALSAGDDPAAIFLYLGPDDDVTRPFCREHVGKVYSRTAIDAMDNGSSLGTPVLLVGGGWNCRHQLIQLSKFSELAPLADTGQRIPEIPLSRAA
jgi:hypothetical protein